MSSLLFPRLSNKREALAFLFSHQFPQPGGEPEGAWPSLDRGQGLLQTDERSGDPEGGLANGEGSEENSPERVNSAIMPTQRDGINNDSSAANSGDSWMIHSGRATGDIFLTRKLYRHERSRVKGQGTRIPM